MNRSALAALVCTGFVLRLGFGLVYWVGKPLMLDEQEYLLLASRLAAGQDYGYPPPSESAAPSRHFERPPVFAFALAGLLRVTADPLVDSARSGSPTLPRSSSEVPRSIKIAQSVVGACGIVLVALLAGRAGGPRAGVAAAAMTAVYPPLVWTCAYVLAEPLYSLLALATAWVLLRATDLAHGREGMPAGSRLRDGIAAGLLAGAALLTKEAMLFFLPFAVAWLFRRRQRLLAYGLVIGVMALTLPWVARNYAVHHRFVLTAAHGGVTLWTGNNPLARGEGDLAANPEMGRARVDLENRHPGMSNQDLDAVYYREVVRYVREHPIDWLILDIKKVFYTFVPIGPSYRLHSDLYYGASLMSYLVLMPAALVGLWSLAARRALSRLWALWWLAISTVLVGIIFFPQERFRIPVLDPTAIVCAAMVWNGRSHR